MNKCAVAAVLAFCLGLVGEAAAQTAQSPHDMHQRHGDPAAYAAALEDPKRDAYQKPDQVITALGISPGEIIADVGAGTGYFSLRLASAVGPKGHVYAVDVSPDMVRRLNERIHRGGVANLTTILAPPDNPLVPRRVHRFFFVNVWHHVADQAGYLAHMKKMLEPGGQIVMIDFHKRDLPVGPPSAMKIAREDLIAQMQAGGFRVAQEHGFLPYQYFLVFKEGQ